MFGFLILRLSMLTAAVCIASAAYGRDYENGMHRFRLANPGSFTFCTDAHVNDHGVAVYLGSVSCAQPIAAPVAKFWAGFNLPGELNDIEAVRNSICPERGHASDIAFGTVTLWPCQTSRQDGSITQTFLGLRPAPGHGAGHWRQIGIAIEAPEAQFAAFRQQMKELAAGIVLLEPLE